MLSTSLTKTFPSSLLGYQRMWNVLFCLQESACKGSLVTNANSEGRMCFLSEYILQNSPIDKAAN